MHCEHMDRSTAGRSFRNFHYNATIPHKYTYVDKQWCMFECKYMSFYMYMDFSFAKQSTSLAKLNVLYPYHDESKCTTITYENESKQLTKQLRNSRIK